MESQPHSLHRRSSSHGVTKATGGVTLKAVTYDEGALLTSIDAACNSFRTGQINGLKALTFLHEALTQFSAGKDMPTVMASPIVRRFGPLITSEYDRCAKPFVAAHALDSEAAATWNNTVRPIFEGKDSVTAAVDYMALLANAENLIGQAVLGQIRFADAFEKIYLNATTYRHEHPQAAADPSHLFLGYYDGMHDLYNQIFMNRTPFDDRATFQNYMSGDNPQGSMSMLQTIGRERAQGNAVMPQTLNTWDLSAANYHRDKRPTQGCSLCPKGSNCTVNLYETGQLNGQVK